jgi:hypothetical protein
MNEPTLRLLAIVTQSGTAWPGMALPFGEPFYVKPLSVSGLRCVAAR